MLPSSVHLKAWVNDFGNGNAAGPKHATGIIRASPLTTRSIHLRGSSPTFNKVLLLYVHSISSPFNILVEWACCSDTANNHETM